mmetsp:Transcript_119834/g.255716  ORF Transcript_119834/g.255716 Transcript_119834/m.255716 type:complete len:201 (-) Transcript_119834:395-997(-)
MLPAGGALHGKGLARCQVAGHHARDPQALVDQQQVCAGALASEHEVVPQHDIEGEGDLEGDLRSFAAARREAAAYRVDGGKGGVEAAQLATETRLAGLIEAREMQSLINLLGEVAALVGCEAEERRTTPATQHHASHEDRGSDATHELQVRDDEVGARAAVVLLPGRLHQRARKGDLPRQFGDKPRDVCQAHRHEGEEDA